MQVRCSECPQRFHLNHSGQRVPYHSKPGENRSYIRCAGSGRPGLIVVEKSRAA